MFGVGFCRPQFGGGEFKLLLCLLFRGFLLGNLCGLSQIFKNLLEGFGTGFELLVEFLLAYHAYENEKLLYVGFGIRSIFHQVTLEGVTLQQLDFNPVRLCDAAHQRAKRFAYVTANSKHTTVGECRVLNSN